MQPGNDFLDISGSSVNFEDSLQVLGLFLPPFSVELICFMPR